MTSATTGKIYRLEMAIGELNAKRTELRDRIWSAPGDPANEDRKAELANVDRDLRHLHFKVAELELAGD